MPDPPSARKPPRRFWLYAPYAALLVVALTWSGAWWALAHQAARRMDQTVDGLRARGWTVNWSARAIGGYPFRLDVTLKDALVSEPSGWALSAPRLDAEAYAYAPGHWVLVAREGVIVTRPNRGAVAITGQALRASVVSTPDQGAPRIAIEGVKLLFTPAQGAIPLPITACDQCGVFFRPLAGDQAEFQLRLQGAQPVAGAFLARLSARQVFNLTWDQSLTHASALKGPNWPTAVRRWSAAGGVLTLNHGELSAAGLTLTLTSGQLTIGPDGRPQGALSLDLDHAGAAARRLGPALALASLFKTELRLQGGALMVGPIGIAAAPKVY